MVSRYHQQLSYHVQWIEAGANDWATNRLSLEELAIERIENHRGNLFCKEHQYLAGTLALNTGPDAPAFGSFVVVDICPPTLGDWWFVWYIHPHTGQYGQRVVQNLDRNLWLFPDHSIESFPRTHILYAGSVSSLNEMHLGPVEE